MANSSVRLFQRVRMGFLLCFTLLTNGFLIGFFKGQIYQGELKKLCLPGLNCYACPGSLGSCPIGALQQSLAGYDHKFPFYVAGSVLIMGSVLGRFVCGWLCPIGLIQDVLHRIRRPFDHMKKGGLKGSQMAPLTAQKFEYQYLRWLKYVFLILFVFILPFTIRDGLGFGAAWFCKYVCPSGVILGGWPLSVSNQEVRHALGWLFGWKSFIAISVIVGSILVYRPFCKYMCPLGAIYGALNKIACLKLHLNQSTCIHCQACVRICPMGVDVIHDPNSKECIRCGRCVSVCPTRSLKLGVRPKAWDQVICKDALASTVDSKLSQSTEQQAHVERNAKKNSHACTFCKNCY